MINFSCRTVNTTPKDILGKMKRAQKNCSMAKFIAEASNLKHEPLLGAIHLSQITRNRTDLR